MNQNEPEPEIPLFSSLIKIHYDRRFLIAARNFVESLAGVAGADGEESAKLALLIEECLVFIIDKYPDCRLDAYIEICFMLMPGNRILIETTDVGPPIHEDRIPVFDIEDETSVSGLWYKLAREMADDFSFVNKYADGWLIRITKYIKSGTFEGNENSEFEEVEAPGAVPDDSKTDRREGNEERTVRLATPDDVQKLIDQAYFTYRYSYAEDFYHTEQLKRLIERKLYEITVLESGDKFIGAYIIKYPESGEKWAEIGSAMLLPEYRLGSSGRVLYRSLIQYLVDNPRDCDFYVSHSVTAHTRSQRGLERAHRGFKPLFLFLNMVQRPDFIGIKRTSADDGRESLIYCYHLNREPRIRTMYALESDAGMVRTLTGSIGGGIDVVTDRSEPVETQSAVNVYQIGHMGFGVINVESIGKDLFRVVNHHIISMISSGIETINVNITTTAPLPVKMEEELAALNLIFCGLSLRSLEHLDLAYCLTIKPVDFDHIKVSGPVAGELLDYIKRGYDELGERHFSTPANS